MCSSRCLYVIFHILFSRSSETCASTLDGCWKGNTYYYKMIGFSHSEESHIVQNIELIHKFVCIRWVDITVAEHNVDEYIKFQKVEDSECSTKVQFRTFRNDSFDGVLIKLSDRCFKEKAVMHEMMHALGFEHEHQRADRDCYVSVSEDVENDDSYKILTNIPEWLERFPYDRYSVLHYPRTSAMKDCCESFFSWEPLGNDKGQLTVLDIWKMMYKFCKFPHYCDLFPLLCEFMDKLEHDCYHSGPRAIAHVDTTDRTPLYL